MSKLPLVVLLAGCWIAVAGPALAGGGQVYRWVDSQDVTHFSDRPPASEATPVTVSRMPLAPAPDVRRQAEMRAWVAEVNRQVNQTIRDDREYRLKRQAIAATAASQEASRAAETLPQPRYASAILPYWGAFPARHFRDRYWGMQRPARPYRAMRLARPHASAHPTFSLGRGGRSTDVSALLNAVPVR